MVGPRLPMELLCSWFVGPMMRLLPTPPESALSCSVPSQPRERHDPLASIRT